MEQVEDWQALYIEDCWGEERADIRSALVARSIVGGQLVDFMPMKILRPEPRISPKELDEKILAAIAGGCRG
jgi:hypothetical protein